jgi:D-beta-D-heptose 7-phosphate kinase/D-beta-D-heptose 1-phosphate adenosyltransferase
MSRDKVLSLEAMREERAKLRAAGHSLVFTNGCFDLLHPGHVRYLTGARAQGDRLVVAVNADRMVTLLKGKGRPILPLAERMEILAALESVDYVVAFEEETPARVIRELMPDVLVKGGDWRTEQIVGRDTVEASGGRVLSLPFAPGYSTSKLIDAVVESQDEREENR